MIHSPLVGAATWRAVAERLDQAHDGPIEAPGASAWQVAAPYYSNLAARIAARLPSTDEAWVLVGHSAAGGLLPSLAAALGDKARGAVFVDAILPHSGRSWLVTAPPHLAASVAEAARDGRAPPWHLWFPPAAIERLVPDQRQLRAFASEIERAPMAYLAEPAPAALGWPPGPCAYLQLSEAYASEAAEAAAGGWPVERLDLDHLAMLSQPDKVAAAIRRLVAGIELRS